VCAAGLVWAAPKPDITQAKAALAQLPLRFEANQGQTAPEVRYTAHAGGYTLFLTARGATIRSAGSKPVTISLENSNRAPRIEALDRLPVRTDYYLGTRENWHTGVPSYSRVRYHDVYPGVDVVYYGNQNQLEYDFVLQPGADPRAIRMKFRGAPSGPGALTISAEGDLVLETSGSRIVQKKPLIYQEDPRTSARLEIAGRYVMVSPNVVGLRVDHYDRGRALVIDPALVYCTYLGGSGTDQINAVKFGPNQTLYIAGQTDSQQIPAINGAYDNNNAGLTDIFLAIVDITPGNGYPLVYFSYLGGANIDIPLALDVDSSGVASLTGTTTSTDYPVTANAFQATGAASSVDAFVSQIDPSLYGGVSLIFSTYLGGSGDDGGTGIAVSNGLLYLIGYTKSADFSVTASAYQPVLWGLQDAFLCQIDPVAGALLYSTYLGGEEQDWGRDILVGPNGLVYFTAATLSIYFPMAGYNYSEVSNLGNSTGAQDIIVGVMDMTQTGAASLVYTTYFGGSGNDDVHGLAFDSKGNLLITGYTLSSDFPVTGNAMQPTYNGNADAYVAVVNPAIPFGGFLIYSTYLGGAHGESAYDVKGDSAGYIYVTGYTLSPDFPSVNAVQAQWGGGTNLFLTKFKPGVAGRGAIAFSTFVGATGTYVPSGLVVGPDGTVYVVGYGTVGLPSSANAIQGGFAGGVDGFLLIVTQ